MRDTSPSSSGRLTWSRLRPTLTYLQQVWRQRVRKHRPHDKHHRYGRAYPWLEAILQAQTGVIFNTPSEEDRVHPPAEAALDPILIGEGFMDGVESCPLRTGDRSYVWGWMNGSIANSGPGLASKANRRGTPAG